ncbi:MAG: ABC transporter ATP-binding protein [Lachnospiraceae bacterium]|nr:ABC transporter ATP-binding protein [Lachnospiraceae bacterium]MBP5653202.1 ABC transporter ATP-binding protein [Lachnospiraceae bacterium]
MSQTKEAVLTAKDLSKTFSNETVQQHVLKNLNLTVYKGDFTVVMGNSGSGKSTLLYALSGMDRPSLGTITYFVGNEDKKSGSGKDIGVSGSGSSDGSVGIEISKFSNDRLALFRRAHAGFVFQQNYLNDSMSALDNVMISGLLKTKDRRALAAKAKDLLGRVEISENDYRKFPTQLSGGQQQRVAVVRGVINDPEILFADEPTGALNSQNTSNVLDILSDLNRQGQSIVMVTHTIKAAERGNRIIYLADGVIADELDLGEYAGDYKDETNPSQERAIERHRKLKDFLQEQGW